MSVELSYEEWSSAIEAAQSTPRPTDGRTSQEWSEILGWGLRKVTNMLRAGVKNGWVEVVYVWRENLSGHCQRRPGYRLVDKLSQAATIREAPKPRRPKRGGA